MPVTLRYNLDGFTSTDIALPTYPVTSVSSIKYDDSDNAEQTVSTDDYYSNLGGVVPLVRAVEYWPVTMWNKPASVRVEFVAGYANTDEIPDDLRHQILLRVSQMFTSDAGDDTDGHLAKPYRRF